MKSLHQRDTSRHVHCNSIHNSQHTDQSKGPSTDEWTKKMGCIHNGMPFSHKKEGYPANCNSNMDGLRIKWNRSNTVWFHFYVGSLKKKKRLIEKDQICDYQRLRVGGSCQVNPTHSYHKAKKRKKCFLLHLYEMRDVNLLSSSHYAVPIKLMQSACWFCLNEATEGKKKKKSKKSAHTLSAMWRHRRPSSTSPGRGLCLEPQSRISDFQSPEPWQPVAFC